MGTQMIAAGDLDPNEAAASQPIGRLGTAEEMAGAVLWLCSPGATFVVGVALPADGLHHTLTASARSTAND